MNLSTLVDYYYHLEILNPKNPTAMINKFVGDSLVLVKNSKLQFPDLISKLDQQYDQINKAFSEYSSSLDEIRVEIKKLINELEPQYFSESYRIYSEEFIQETSDYILQRKLELTDEARKHLSSRIKRHGHWQHAGMIIRPGIDSWAEDLVGCDPLYLIDRDMQLLRPTVDQFNPQYQNRLRTYFLKTAKPGDRLLGSIPDGQFAFCLAYYFFNFAPFELIKSYFTTIYEKLKPGGTLAFTFNNCDLPGGVLMVERHFMCYTPGKMLLTLAESIGYEISHTYQIDNACVWVELLKPGKLTSLRGGQSLAHIKPKAIAKSK